MQGGERRLGWGAIAAGVIGAVGAVVATKSGESNLEDVFVWSALIAAMLRFATPLAFAALGGIVSERSGVINIGLEGMMLMGAFFGIFGADLTGSWLLGALIGMAAGGVLACCTRSCRSPCVPTRWWAAPHQLSGDRHHRLRVRRPLRRSRAPRTTSRACRRSPFR